MISAKRVESPRVAPFSALVGRLLIKVKWVSLTNLIMQKELFPELLQERATGEMMASQLAAWLDIPPQIEAVRAELAELRRRCGEPADHLLPKGFKGIRDEAQALLDAVDLTVPANYEKRDFWQAAVIVNEGLRILCRRHAEAAEALAARESGPIRKAELLNIASDCAFLADNPPATGIVQNNRPFNLIFEFAHIAGLYFIPMFL